MGLISSTRLGDAKATYPFRVTAVNATGPFTTKLPKGQARRKWYLLVFTCCAFRCVHLEVMTDLSVEAFLMAFQHFLGRRNRPEILMMDNGTNFVGAARELQREWREIQDDLHARVHGQTSDCPIKFQFHVSYTPYRNGAVEKMIGCAKRALLRNLPLESAVSEKELHTLVAEVEGVLNARPITYIGSDINDLEALTPNHFLARSTYLSMLQKPGKSWKRRWDHLRFLQDRIWHCLWKEYIPGLQGRAKWRKATPNLRKGDIILSFEPDTKHWPLAQVLEALPNVQDGLVHVVSARHSDGKIIKRDVSKVVLLLPAEEELVDLGKGCSSQPCFEYVCCSVLHILIIYVL